MGPTPYGALVAAQTLGSCFAGHLASITRYRPLM